MMKKMACFCPFVNQKFDPTGKMMPIYSFFLRTNTLRNRARQPA